MSPPLGEPHQLLPKHNIINFAPRITSLLPTENINISSPSTSSFFSGKFPKSCSRHQAPSLQSLPQKTQHSHVNGELEASSHSPRTIINFPRRHTPQRMCLKTHKFQSRIYVTWHDFLNLFIFPSLISLLHTCEKFFVNTLRSCGKSNIQRVKQGHKTRCQCGFK